MTLSARQTSLTHRVEYFAGLGLIDATSLLERAFQKSWRRTAVIPYLFDEQACLELVSASVRQKIKCWRRVMMMTGLARQQSALLVKNSVAVYST